MIKFLIIFFFQISSDAKHFFFSYPRHCDRRLINVILYYFRIRKKKNTTVELLAVTWVACVMIDSSYFVLSYHHWINIKYFNYFDLSHWIYTSIRFSLFLLPILFEIFLQHFINRYTLTRGKSKSLGYYTKPHLIIEDRRVWRVSSLLLLTRQIGQVNLFKDYSYVIALCAKYRGMEKQISNNYTKNINMNVQRTWFPNFWTKIVALPLKSNYRHNSRLFVNIFYSSL